jgi:long-chain acyl-CoA synthetase
VAKLWLEKTGCPICEGYGLSETSPSASCNPVTSTEYTGTIGVPLPSTWHEAARRRRQRGAALGQPGEIAIKGPQVMAGYWQRPDETAKVMTADGFFKHRRRRRDGRARLLQDRRPQEGHDPGQRLQRLPQRGGRRGGPDARRAGVRVVGVPDAKSGEAVKLVIVKKDPALTEAEVRAYCKANLTGYKQPKMIEFRTELPKTPVGKILRRELRDSKL